MPPTNPEDSGIWLIDHNVQIDEANSNFADAAMVSAEIIRYLPLVAANDFLDQDDNLPPVA